VSIKVSVITRVHNNREITKRCIESIQKNTRNIEYEHIVIDNGSTDGTAEYLRGLDFILISNEKNAGCAAALNQGIEKASGEYVCNVDNDVVVSENWLEPLVETAEQIHDAGIVSPGTREGRLDYDFEKYAANYKRRMNSVVAREFGGWCMLIKRKMFELAGNFSEEFNMYCEDTDFYMRVKKAGYEAYRTGKSFVHHEGNVTLCKIPQKQKLEHEHVLRLREKWGIKEDGYFLRKMKSFGRLLKNSYFMLAHGHLPVERMWRKERGK